jgi:hypothetical protein
MCKELEVRMSMISHQLQNIDKEILKIQFKSIVATKQFTIGVQQ